jgi:hypothetical protein
MNVLFSFSSGGNKYISHVAFKERPVNPENVFGVTMTYEKVYSSWRTLLKKYRSACERFESPSGQHSGRDFWQFCNNDTDVLYLRLSLENLGNPELNKFVAGGYVVSSGFDTSKPTVPEVSSALVLKKKKTSPAVDSMSTLSETLTHDPASVAYAALATTQNKMAQEQMRAMYYNRVKELRRDLTAAVDEEERCFIEDEVKRCMALLKESTVHIPRDATALPATSLVFTPIRQFDEV